MVATLQGTDHYVYRPDGQVYYYKVGKGEPLILLHNFGFSGFMWRKMIDKLAQHFTCYNVDLPGWDHSQIPRRKYMVPDFTRAVLDVMDIAGIRSTDILAHAGGAMVALDLAANYPDRVKKLVLDGLPYWDLEHGRIIWERTFVPQFTDTTAYSVPVHSLTTWEQAVKANPNLDREHWEKNEAIKRRSRRWTRTGYWALSNYDNQAMGPKVKAPTLLIYGERSPHRRVEQVAHETIKGSALAVVPGVVFAFDRPEELTKLTLDFLL
ncbi:MAG: alpha/beta hydrolase [Chloroflexi bacterium]|nr:alpha/beta hydrolase [Chloroflexota bacterium]